MCVIRVLNRLLRHSDVSLDATRSHFFTLAREMPPGKRYVADPQVGRGSLSKKIHRNRYVCGASVKAPTKNNVSIFYVYVYVDGCVVVWNGLKWVV